ncbi:GNAT family N-acetyltransferase [Nakamurella endophytica]|uniref:Ribosomal-protein-alanine acetyltransferase n=1 Tax=Nakamurella endophytica TaxID=1748367 RepID=A0A917SZP8_9ACTN|nr:GNAT family N-acetyltransferase [Nakamurella endophytica]GGM02968.1 ribosomal-protein-alanine acetyltransferase [Nakamurella endophytica]
MTATAVTLRPEPVRWWDIPALVRLEELLFPGDSPWTAAMFWSELAAGHHYVVVREPAGAAEGSAEVSADGSAHGTGDVLAYAGLARTDDEAEVQTIGVRPDRQHAGLGRVLLRDLLRAAGPRRVLLEVRTDNAPAIALYESEGFRRMGVRRGYYQPSGADAWTMERPAGASAASGGER